MTVTALDTRRTIRFICKACNGTGHSRYREYDDCDVCDGKGTISSYIALKVYRDAR